jgi:hypothetical protein
MPDDDDALLMLGVWLCVALGVGLIGLILFGVWWIL